MSDEGLKALLGSIEEPESEEYEYKDHYEAGLKNYDFIETINAIGTEEFETIYKMIMSIEPSIDDLRNLAREILEKINELYEIEIELPRDPLREEVDGIFRFLEFLEYDYIPFFAHVWKVLGIDLRTPIRDYCYKNGNKIIDTIEDQLDSHFLHPLVVDFLRTNNKDDMVKLFVELTEKSKMLIVVEIERERLSHEGK